MKYELWTSSVWCPVSPAYNLVIMVWSDTGEKFLYDHIHGKLVHSLEMEPFPDDCVMLIPKMIYEAIGETK